jgi:hypothetical protein
VRKKYAFGIADKKSRKNQTKCTSAKGNVRVDAATFLRQCSANPDQLPALTAKATCR